MNLGNVSIRYKPALDEPEGHAHFGVFGINRSRAEKLARIPELTHRVKGPGAPELPPAAADRGDEPTDIWQQRR